MKVLVASTGGSPDQFLKSIEFSSPELCLFFTSEEGRLAIEKSIPNLDSPKIPYQVFVTKNVNDLLVSYQCALQCLEELQRIRKSKEIPLEVIVDYTGGTKNMSVALALAFLFEGFPYQYVGGGERTKQGMGQVVSGSELPYASVNPWTFLAIQEKRTLVTLLEQYEYSQAHSLCIRLSESGWEEEKSDFKKFAKLVFALYKWDLFQYKEAGSILAEKKLTERTDKDPDFYHQGYLQQFAEVLAQNKPIRTNLEILQTQSSGKPTRELLLDLLANAKRRASQGKFDDAMLRIYRALELMAQKELLENHRIETGNLRPDQIPKSLQPKLLPRFNKESETLKIGLEDSWELLLSLGDPIASAYQQNRDLLRKIQVARNESLLAHGFTPVSESTYEKLKTAIYQIAGIREQDLIEFPKIKLE